jgi:hypothetical protein
MAQHEPIARKERSTETDGQEAPDSDFLPLTAGTPRKRTANGLKYRAERTRSAHLLGAESRHADIPAPRLGPRSHSTGASHTWLSPPPPGLRLLEPDAGTVRTPPCKVIDVHRRARAID